MKSEDFKFLALYTFTTFVVIFLFSFFTLDDYQSLSSHFGERPFEICRVITNHVYKDIYYGGLGNIFGLIGWYFLYGIYIFAFSFIATYFVDRYLFKGSFFQLEKASEGINPYKEKMKDKYIFILFLPIPPFIYDLLPFLFFKNLTCMEVIKYVESSY